MAAVGERIRASSGIVLYREDPLRVYLVERNPAQRFFPGFHAFPGGTLDPEEVQEGGPAAFRRAALRELFEETGVLLMDGPRPDAEAREAARAALDAGDAGAFDRLLAAAGARPTPEALEPCGRLLTPPFAPVRYDTQFYVARCPDDEEPTIRHGELVGGAWVEPHEALARWERDAWPVPPPTLAYLRVLARDCDVAKACAWARGTDGERHHRRFRIEFQPGVFVLPQRVKTLPPATTVNTYFIAGERDLYVIDPGTVDAADREALAYTVDGLLAEGRRPAAVLLTHHHHDHVGSVGFLKEKYGFRVLAHPLTAQALGGVDGALEDGDVLELGAWQGRPWRVRVLHTPGHAPGHLAFRDERWGALLTGDLVSAISTMIIDPPEGDMAAYLASLNRLIDLDPPVLLPSHGPLVPGRGLLVKTRDHRLQREAKVQAALGEDARPVTELVPVAYEDTPRELWALAERSLLAHLLKLEADGAAQATAQGWRRAGDGS